MLWLGEVIGVVAHKLLPKIPVSALLRASMAASGSKWTGNLAGASSHFVGNLSFLHHGKGKDSIHTALGGDRGKSKLP